MTLHELIRTTLGTSKEPDPHVIAKKLIKRMTSEERDAALYECLPDRVRIEITRDRMGSLVTAAEPAGPVGSSRLASYANVLGKRYCVAGTWKLLGDCSADDCDLLAEEYAKRASEMAEIAARFRRLGDELRRAGARTVAELGDDGLAVAA